MGESGGVNRNNNFLLKPVYHEVLDKLSFSYCSFDISFMYGNNPKISLS
jgi:hypothetical protein